MANPGFILPPVFINETTSYWTIRRGSLQKHESDANEMEIFLSDSLVLEAWSRWDKPRFAQGYDVTNIVATYTATNELTTRVLHDYMSGRSTKIPKSVIALSELLRVSDMLLIYDLIYFCTDCIKSLTVDEDNCFDILETCSLYNIEHFEINQYIRGHLESLSKSKRMLNLSYQSLLDLLNDEELSYWPEDDRYILITNWCSASDDRASRFEPLFDSLDLNKIHRDIIWSVLRNDEHVRGSRTVTLKINDFLRFEENTNIPVVYRIGREFGDENWLGFNIEEKNIFRVKFPHTMSVGQNLVTSDDKENIIMCQDGKILELDVTTNKCKERYIVWDEKIISTITHVLFDETIVFFGTNHVQQSKRHNFSFGRMIKPVSTLFCVKENTDEFLKLQPILSFEFEISCACIRDSKIFLTSSVYKYKGQVMCYNLIDCSLGVIYCLPTTSYGTLDTIRRMFPMNDQLLFVTIDRILSISRTDYRKNEFEEEIFTTIGNPMYAQISETIIELCDQNIRVMEFQTHDSNKISVKSSTFTPEHFNGKYLSACAIGGVIPRTKPLCHIMCPHCDPNAWEKEEEEKNRLEVERQRLANQSLYSAKSWSDDDDDDYKYDYGYQERYDDDYYGWNKPEMFWDNSADEWVEAWW